MDKDAVIARFVSALPARFDAAGGDPRMNGVVIDVDPADGRATAIARLSLSEDQLKEITDSVTAAAGR
jgi:calcineurin-like phosphoesterase